MAKYKRGRPYFLDRMKREGRDKEWYRRLREYQASHPDIRYSKASYVVMREMGYEDIEKERALCAAYEATLHKTACQKEIDQNQREIREEQRVATFEQAIASLPGRGTASAEIDWIRSHPAMTRQDRQRDKTKPVFITAADILFGGGAPSRAAVYALQHWANRPGEFYKQLLGEQKKKSEDEGSEDTGPDPALAEVEKILAQIEGAAA